MNWLKVNFSQAFSAWIHLKTLRIFTESVLRSVTAQPTLATFVCLQSKANRHVCTHVHNTIHVAEVRGRVRRAYMYYSVVYPLFCLTMLNTNLHVK